MRFLTRHFSMLAALIVMAAVSGCDRRTPDERLHTATEFYKQGDQLSAEMEALKVVEKAPEDPAAVQANMLLAQIYAGQNRSDEAALQMQSALKNVSQLEPMGKEILRNYLGLLNSQKKYDEALKVISKYQKEYAKDPGTSLSLAMAGVEVETMAGQTTAARTALSDQMAQTTMPEEMALYRQMYVRTFLRDENTTAAIAYLEVALPSLKRPEEKQQTMVALASLYGTEDNYEKSRFYVENLTQTYLDLLKAEPNPMGRFGLTVQLGQTYVSLSNLPGGEKVFQTAYDRSNGDPQVVMAAVNGLAQTLLRMGKTSETQTLLQDVAKKYPKAPFAPQLKQLEEIIASGKIKSLAPEDTSTLAMRYRADQNLLWPAELPELLGEAHTSGTVSRGAAGETSATLGVTNANATTATATPPSATVAPESVDNGSSLTSTVGNDTLTTVSGKLSLAPLESDPATTAPPPQ